MTTRYLCTYFDSAYLAKGLALMRSLARHVPDWHLYVLALDNRTFDVVGELAATLYAERVTVLPLHTIESRELLAVRQARSWKEYIWTLTASWAMYVIDRWAPPALAYIDADCYFFGDVDLLYGDLGVGSSSVAVIPHRWTPRHAERLRPNGLFNVGWVYWRNDANGWWCLEDWQARCLAWQPEPARPTFSDQIYLDAWPEHYGARVIENIGCNLAPWNQEQYEYEWDAEREQRLWVIQRHPPGWQSAAKLVFYHFHEFQRQPDGTLRRTGYPLHPLVAQHVYAPYEQEMADVERQIA